MVHEIRGINFWGTLYKQNKKVINRLINIKFKMSIQLGRGDCGGEISEKASLWGVEISPHGQFKY